MTNGRRIPWWGWTLIAVGVVCAVGAFIIFKLWLPLWAFFKCAYQWLTVTDEVDVTRHMYLLSATAQVLGALFALVFSITILAAQFVTKYTRRMMRIIFHKWVIVFMIFFAFSVILPLWLLRSPTNNGSLISVAYGSVILSLLIWFFLDMRKRIDVTNIEKFLRKDGERSIERGEYDEFTKTLLALDQAGTKALKDKEIELYEPIQSTIADFAITIEKKALELERVKKTGGIDKRTTLFKLHKQVFTQQQLRAKEFIDDSNLPHIVIRNVGRIGVQAIKNEPQILWETDDAARVLIVEIAQLCDRDTRIPLSVDCVMALKQMLNSVPPKNTNRTKELMEDIIGIFNIHFEHKWKKHLPKFLHMTFEFLTKYENQPDTPEFLGRLLDHFFQYYNFFLENNMANLASQSLNEIYGIIEHLQEIYYHPDFTKYFLEKLGKYITVCTQKGDDPWRGIVKRIESRIVTFAGLLLNNSSYELFREAQMVYLPVMGLGYLINFFPTFLKQTSDFTKKKEYPLDAEWSKNIAWALKTGVIAQTKSNKPELVKVIVRHWNDIINLSNYLIRVNPIEPDHKGDKEKVEWQQSLVYLHDMFKETMLDNQREETKGFLDQKELLKGVAQTLSTLSVWIGQYCRPFAERLNKQGLLDDFIEAFKLVKDENEKLELGIPGKFIDETQKVFEDIRKELRP